LKVNGVETRHVEYDKISITHAWAWTMGAGMTELDNESEALECCVVVECACPVLAWLVSVSQTYESMTYQKTVERKEGMTLYDACLTMVLPKSAILTFVVSWVRTLRAYEQLVVAAVTTNHLIKVSLSIGKPLVDRTALKNVSQ
jgi:hypothetical protein